MFDYDNYFLNIGISVLSRKINSYLGSNYPTDDHRELLKYLFETFYEFRIKTIVYRAIKNKIIPKNLRNKFVSGCSTKEDVINFIKKRYDKGYNYIVVSKEPIEAFDLYSFIEFINNKYGDGSINNFYQDEKEVFFKFKKGNDWFEMIDISK